MLYRLHIATIVLSCLVLISACASKPDRNRKSSETFNTDIKSNGSKRFTLTIIEASRSSQRNSHSDDSERGQRGSRGQRGEGGQGGQGRGREQRGGGNSLSSSYEDARARVITSLDKHLADTQYCRNGYIELDYTSVKGESEIVGECQESASDEDRSRW